jgi:hypothetical protein
MFKYHYFHLSITSITPLTTLIILVALTRHAHLTLHVSLRLAKRPSAKSHLQTEIALSTMEAEYIPLSTSCRDHFPLIDITKEICLIFDDDLVVNETADMHMKNHKDNVGALALGKLVPHRMLPHFKHYAIKYHWFRKHIGLSRIQLAMISSEDQLGDLFARDLSRVEFSRLKKKLMGW